MSSQTVNFIFIVTKAGDCVGKQIMPCISLFVFTNLRWLVVDTMFLSFFT